MQHVTLDRLHRPFRHVLIVDDHPLYSDALAATLDHIFAGIAFQKAGTLREALETLDRGFAPDLVMFDLKLPDVAGISGFANMRRRLPDVPIVVISSLASNAVIASLMQEGAAGFMPKDCCAQDLKTMIAEIAMGRKYVPRQFAQAALHGAQGQAADAVDPNLAALTPQQKRVMKLICAGKPNKQIAYELDLAEATVKAHITALLRRLGVKNRTQAAVMFEAAQIGAMDGAEAPEIHSFLTR